MHRRGAASRSSSTRCEQLGSAAEHVVRTRAYLVHAADWEAVGRAHGEVFADVRPASAFVVVAGLLDDAVARRDRGGGARPLKQVYPPSITGKGSRFAEGGSVLDHAFGKSDPFTLGRRGGVHAARRRDVRPRAAHRHRARRGLGPRARAAHQPGADAVGARGRDACLPHARGRAPSSCARSARFVCEIARERGMRVGSAGTHPFSLFERQRITAKDRYRAMVDQHAVHRAARADLRDARARRRRRPGEGDPGRERADRASRRARRALRELAVLARRADRARAPRGTWSTRPSRARARRRASATTTTTPRSSGQLERTGCIADYTHIWWDIRLHPRLGTIEIRICDARDAARGRDRASPRTARRSSSTTRSASTRGEEIPSFHRILTTENKWLAARYGLEAPVMDLATGRRNRVPGRALDPPHAEDARARTRASSARRRSSPASRRSCAAATAPTGSFTSSTRTATSSRSCARSQR